MSDGSDSDVIKYAFAFLGGSVVTFIIQSVWSYITRPKLRLITEGNTGLFVRSPGHWMIPNQAPQPEDFAFLRALVRNDGWRSAKSCVAYISKLIWIDGGGNEHVFSDSDLVEMQWSWRGHASVDIPRGAHLYIDLFKFWRSTLDSAFCSDRFPRYLQTWGAGGGQMHFFLRVCCDNAPPADGHMLFRWDGTWQGGRIET
jgi:hypothetical protein